MIRRWDIITIGNLSRNRYWGEDDSRARRSPICTTTLITGDDFRLLVDPSLSDADRMMVELDRRAGVPPEAIIDVFITHEHGDHYAGIAAVPSARWTAAPPVADALNGSGRLAEKVTPVTGELFGCIDILPTPGHCDSHHSLRFDLDGRSVVVAGDATMTRDFWRERQGYFNSSDFELAARTMDRLSRIADIVIPGHDNYFLVLPTS